MSIASSDEAGDAAPAAVAARQPMTRAESLRILVAHPVVYGLAQQMLRGVDGVELVRVAPARLPANRLPAYLIGRGQDALMRAAAQAHAVLSLRSVWPDDQLYPLARRANIRIIEIDVANPIEGDLPGITSSEAVPQERAEVSPDRGSVLFNQPWQDNANLARMTSLMADALVRLSPQQAARLQANQLAIHQRLQHAEIQVSRALAQASDLSVLLLSPRLQALVTALQLEPVDWQEPSQDADLPTVLAEALARSKARVVLTHAAPEAAVEQAIQASGARLVVLAENAADPVAALAEAMRAIGEAMRGAETSGTADRTKTVE